MGENANRRASIDRMTRQIIESNQGKVSTTEARKIAKDAAIRADRRDKKR